MINVTFYLVTHIQLYFWYICILSITIEVKNMIKFINIGCQTGNRKEGIKEFCFFDTGTDIFIRCNGESCWTCKEEFENDFKDGSKSLNGNCGYGLNAIKRFTSLIPDTFNKKN